jgi:hypothetical protein
MVKTKLELDMEEVSVFNRTVQPNINIHRVDTGRLVDRTKHDSMTNIILADNEGLEAVMTNLDTKYSIFPFKYTTDGIVDDKARLFSCNQDLETNTFEHMEMPGLRK